jgi:hypothetical protein
MSYYMYVHAMETHRAVALYEHTAYRELRRGTTVAQQGGSLCDSLKLTTEHYRRIQSLATLCIASDNRSLSKTLSDLLRSSAFAVWLHAMDRIRTPVCSQPTHCLGISRWT